MHYDVLAWARREGRQRGVPHADYFEGLMSHKTRWQQQRPSDDIIVPLFEIVYGDAIPIYTHQSDRPRVDSPTYGGRFNRTDQFIKNTYEVLSPLGRVTALLPMTDHRFVTPDRKVETTRFGNDVNITVNYGESEYSTPRAVLPQYGFVIESPMLVAFCARSYGELKYSEPAMFVIRSLDGKPLASSGQVRIYHAFGDSRVQFRGSTLEVETERIVSN